MKNEIEIIHGSGNVFRDLGLPTPETDQLKAFFAAKIIAVLNNQNITVRRTHEITSFAAADFSRIRQTELSRYTIDRLMAMLERLNRGVDETVKMRVKKFFLHYSFERLNRW